MYQCKLLGCGNLFHGNRDQIHVLTGVLNFFFFCFPSFFYPCQRLSFLLHVKTLNNQLHIISDPKTFHTLLFPYRRNSRLVRDWTLPFLFSFQMAFPVLFPTKYLLIPCHRVNLYVCYTLTFEAFAQIHPSTWNALSLILTFQCFNTTTILNPSLFFLCRMSCLSVGPCGHSSYLRLPFVQSAIFSS